MSADAARPASGGAPILHVALAGASASLSSPHAEFMRYAEEHLAPLRAAASDAPTIEATLTWHEGPPGERLATYPELREMQRVDRDIYRSATGLAWFRIDDLPPLHLRVTCDGERLRVHGDFFMYLSRNRHRDWLKRGLYWRRVASLRRRRFTTLLYYLIYYPAFWWLERHHGLHPIHAGAVELPEGVIVFAGPSGVGKSTLVTGLSGKPGARLVSDTFLLHRGAEVCAVPEPLLLDPWSQRWVGSSAAHLAGLDHRYVLGRKGFHWAADQISAGGRARLLVFPQRGTTHALRPLTPSAARGRMTASNLIVNDLRRYWAFASVFELLDPTPLVSAREEQIALLARDVPAYELSITRSMTLDGVLDELVALMGCAALPLGIANASHALVYVKAGPGASATDFDCKADGASAFGACIFDLPAAGMYSVFLQEVAGPGDYQVTATIFGGPPPLCGDGILDFNEQCDDGNTAGGDCCDASCRYEANGSPCPADGDVCTADVCDGAGTCGVFDASPCDDGDPCTRDSCEAGIGCVSAATPATGCRTAGKSLLLLKNRSDDRRDSLTWKWLQGAATSLAELGLPIGATNDTLCLYAGTSVASLAIPAGTSWQPLGNKGYRFNDPTGAPDGARTTVLKSGTAGGAKVLVEGRGANLPDALAPPLPMPVTVQLVNDTNSVCFESVYHSAAVNKQRQFRAKTP